MSEKPETQDDPYTSMTIVIGAIGVFILFLVIVGLQALFYHVQKVQNQEKSYGYAFDKLKNAQSEQQQQLHTYRLTDPAKGTAAIPIDRAMELSVAELQRTAQTQPFLLEKMP